MTCRWRWFIHTETAISINRNGSIPLCVFKTHYRDRGAAVPNHRIFMQIQFSGHYGDAAYSRSGAIREFYQANLAKIEYDERVGKLLGKEEVQAAAFNTYRQYRDQMLNIPDRMAAILAAESDAKKCHEILTAEIRRALNDFSDS